MSENLRDSSYEQCSAVDNITKNEPYADYVELSDSTYDKIPDLHFDGENYTELNRSHHEYTTPMDCQDYSLKDSLQYEKPLQVARPLNQLQPQRQHNNCVPELFKDTTQRNEVETRLQSNRLGYSKRSKRLCFVGVMFVLTMLVASGIATFLVFHLKEQENTLTILTTSFNTFTTMTTMTPSVPSLVTASTFTQSSPFSPTMTPTTVGTLETVTTSTTTTTVVPATVFTTTLRPATTTNIQTTNPSSTPPDMFKDCKELKLNGNNNDGVYTIYPCLLITTSVRVYCDMTTDGGGWTVFQHRRDGSVDFYLLWDNYKKGFGDPNGEYWLGNDHLHQLTSLGTSDFYVRLEKFTGGWAYAKYNNFSVADESDGYRMRLRVGSYQGNAGDSIESFSTTNTNGYKFSTSDKDNDHASASCAVARKGAWWYNECTWANLNGIYGNGSCVVNGICNFWYTLTNSLSGAKTSLLMVRRVK